MEKDIALAVVLEISLLGLLVYKWLHRNEESQTSTQPDDVKRLETLETRVSAKRRRELTLSEKVVKKLTALKRRSDMIDKRGM